MTANGSKGGANDGSRFRVLPGMRSILDRAVQAGAEGLGVRGLYLYATDGRGGSVMDGIRDAGILALAVVAVACLAVHFLGVAHPAGAVVDFIYPLFPRL